ncbi:hypothetical protein [Hahella sp. NBU794]|uniref:hypothetical protein n=1 Tax=Hahella sp. NBU794 TaxID=3422590 RepID=UPI003D6EEBAE
MELNAGVVDKLIGDWKDKSGATGPGIKAKWLSTLEADIDLTPGDDSPAKPGLDVDANIAPTANESAPPTLGLLQSGVANEVIVKSSLASSISPINNVSIAPPTVDKGVKGINAKSADTLVGMRQTSSLDERQSVGKSNRLVTTRSTEYVSQLLGELYPATNIHITKNGDKLVVWIRDYKQQHKQALLDLSKVIVETLGCDEDQLSFMFNGKPLHEDKDSLSAVSARNTFNQE